MSVSKEELQAVLVKFYVDGNFCAPHQFQQTLKKRGNTKMNGLFIYEVQFSPSLKTFHIHLKLKVMRWHSLFDNDDYCLAK